ncbi:MAG: hypothetical protein GF418_14035 [Chitinivibrionales bacterium]|nr:hypothetical protein [Chitinivibrionales bacterium]MBD3396738.1 hypothetical protein [Chitinivibrionales bacterium]
MRLIVWTMLAGMALVFSGCRLLSSDLFDAKDGNAGLVATEVVSMGEAVGELWDEGGMAKSRSSAAETVYVDIEIQPWAYDNAAKCWTRSSRAQFDNGDRVREDTVWLFGPAGDTVKTPSFSTVSSYRHVRSVHAEADNAFDNRLDMNVDIRVQGDDTLFVKNGTITGHYNGTQYSTTTITDLTRQWHRGRVPHLAFPSSGTVAIDRPLRTIDVEFEGDGEGSGTATATATRKRDGKTTVYVINVERGTESDA